MSVQLQKPAWVTQFQISDSTWMSLVSEASALQVTPLALACEKGLEKEEDLLRLEQQRSELPVLAAPYFDTNPPEGIFVGYDVKAFKKEGILPLSPWEGHTLFGKMSADVSEFQKTIQGAIFVLAPWSGMKKWFAIWEKQSGVQDTPQGIKITETKANDALAGINFGEIKLGDLTAPTPPPTAPTPTPPPRAPVPPASTEPLTFDASSLTSMIQITPPPSQPAVPVPPEPAKATAPAAPSVPPPAHNIPPIPPQVVQAYPTMATPEVTIYGQAPQIPQTPQTPQPTAPTAPVAPSVPLPTPTTLGTTMQSAEAPVIPFDQITDCTKSARSLEELYLVVIGAWKNFFERVMVFNYSSLQNKLNSVKWSGPWKNVNPQKVISVNTLTPSIFKIALDTGHPYHGYIMHSPVNQTFFAEANGGEYPEHVTITCVMNDDRPALLILGICSKQKAMTFNVNQIESLSDTFNEHYKRIASALRQAG